MPTAEPVVREIDISATPETVFEFFVDPAKITRWLADDATLDPRPGGVCHLQPGGPGGGMEGEYLEVDAPKRVVFTWGFTKPGSAVPPGGSTVEVTFTPIPSGTRVRLVHSGLPADVAASHFEGWTVKLGRLADAAQDIRTDRKGEG